MNPSPPHLTQVTGRVWPDRVKMQRLVLVSHTLAVPSWDADTKRRQGISTWAGSQAIDMIHLEWPARKQTNVVSMEGWGQGGSDWG